MLISNYFTILCHDGEKFYQCNVCDYFDHISNFVEVSDLSKFGLIPVYRNEEWVHIFDGKDVLYAKTDLTVGWDDEVPWSGMFHIKSYVPVDVPTFDESENIPKIIHQTDNTDQPREQFYDNIAQLKELNPNWEYRYYSEKDRVEYIRKNYGDKILDIYNRIHPSYGAAKADLFRYLLIYKEGGMYLDMKSGVIKSIDDIIGDDHRMALAFWKHTFWPLPKGLAWLNADGYLQWYILSKAGNPLLKKVIVQVLANLELYDSFFNGVGRDTVLEVTGPVPYTRVLYPHQSEVRMIQIGKEGIIHQNMSVYKRLTQYRTSAYPLMGEISIN